MKKDSFANTYIYKNPVVKSKPELKSIKKTLAVLDNPQDKIKVIHVAGTNGKGSCCAMLKSILMQAGLKVGMFTSPHLVKPNERFVINDKQISNADLDLYAKVISDAQEIAETKLNIFEKITAIGFEYFYKKKCDVVILEVGLGGRYDATNIISNPLVSIIMNIGLDHTEILGDTIEKIAYEKAGIIKNNGITVAYQNKKSVLKIFKEEAIKNKADLRVADFEKLEIINEGLRSQKFNYKEYKNLKLSLLGKHQFCNACTALEAIDVLKELGYKITSKNVRDGLIDTRWIARLSILSRKPMFILDGGHNPQCAKALKDSLPKLLNNKKAIMLCGMLKDKDYKEVMDIVSPLAKEFIIVTPNSYRALDGKDLADYLHSKGKIAYATSSIKEGMLLAFDEASNKDTIVAFGSLYLAGDIIDIFDKTLKEYLNK